MARLEFKKRKKEKKQHLLAFAFLDLMQKTDPYENVSQCQRGGGGKRGGSPLRAFPESASWRALARGQLQQVRAHARLYPATLHFQLDDDHVMLLAILKLKVPCL